MDLNQAILFGQIVNAAYAIQPDDIVNRAGSMIPVGGINFTVATSIYANDLATDMDPNGGNQRVSIGLILQSPAGDVVIAIRGTVGIMEWIHDAQFLWVPCPFLPGAGNTDDGFTAMYESFEINTAAGSPNVVDALPTLPFAQPVKSLTICGHSLGASLATLLALDVASHCAAPFNSPAVYTYASPRVGDATFAAMYNHVVPNTNRIANRIDLVPNLPPAPMYVHVNGLYDLNPIQLLPLPPKVLINPTVACEHVLDSYLYLLSLAAGGAVLPLDATCTPPVI
ncbi:MAG TPA: lipase family protein [Tepidisphaeraceae bacterium]|nr:lipase family protein [Tepidisphaeraceae bacterium]